MSTTSNNVEEFMNLIHYPKRIDPWPHICFYKVYLLNCTKVGRGKIFQMDLMELFLETARYDNRRKTNRVVSRAYIWIIKKDRPTKVRNCQTRLKSLLQWNNYKCINMYNRVITLRNDVREGGRYQRSFWVQTDLGLFLRSTIGIWYPFLQNTS